MQWLRCLCRCLPRRAPLISLTEKQSWYENISVTDWEIVSRNVPQEPFLLKKEKHLNMMKKPSKKRRKKLSAKNQARSAHTGCPGSRSHANPATGAPETDQATFTRTSGIQAPELAGTDQSWRLFSAPYFNGAKLLIAADCTAYAYAGFHQDFMRNKVTLIGCPKLDQVDYSEKLTAIIQNNRHSKCNDRKNGSSMLRWSGNGSKKSASKQRKIYTMAGCNDKY